MKVIHFQIDEELHKKLKMIAIQNDKSIKQYVTDLIRQDTETKKEQTQ